MVYVIEITTFNFPINPKKGKVNIEAVADKLLCDWF